MQAQILLLAAFAILALIAIRAGRSSPRPVQRGLQIAAMVLLVLYAAFFALFGFGEIFSGDFSGAIHLVPMLILLLLLAVVRRIPLESGVVLTGLGLLTTAIYALPPAQNWTLALLLGLPWLLIGPLLLAAVGLASRRVSAPN